MIGEQEEILRRMVRDSGPGGHVYLKPNERQLLERLVDLEEGQAPSPRDGRWLHWLAVNKFHYYRKWRPGGLLSRARWRYDLKEDTHGE